MSKELRESDLNAPLIFSVGVASVVWVAIIVLFTRAWVFQQQDAAFDRSFVRQTPRQLAEYQSSSRELLNGYPKQHELTHTTEVSETD